MSIRGDESYVEIEGELVKRTAKAILIKTDLSDGWVARSCCHFTTDKAADKMVLGDSGIFKIMRWVAEERGFL